MNHDKLDKGIFAAMGAMMGVVALFYLTIIVAIIVLLIHFL